MKHAVGDNDGHSKYIKIQKNICCVGPQSLFILLSVDSLLLGQ